MSEEPIEFSSRGKRQLKSIIYSEIKPQIDAILEDMINTTVEKRIKAKLDNYLTNSQMEHLVKRQIEHLYWKQFNQMLQESNFQEKLQEEIIAYLHKRWACGTTPFEDQFNQALMKALKGLLK